MYNVETNYERDGNAAVLYDAETNKDRPIDTAMKEMATLPLCETETDKDRPTQPP